MRAFRLHKDTGDNGRGGEAQLTEFERRHLADAPAREEDLDHVHGGPPDISWPVEDAFWREHYSTRPYAIADRGYAYYRDAYRYGVETCLKHRGLSWDDHIEANLARGWLQSRGTSKATWEQAKPAVYDAWERTCGRGLC